jgi:hypothetical protein
LARGAYVNAAKTSDGSTALMIAAGNGHTEIVAKLLARGADVNAERTDGVTALMYAALNGHTEIVDKLLARGADVDAKIPYGSAPLMLAALMGHTETNCATALMLAAQRGHTETVLAFLSRDDVNWKEVLNQLSHPELQNLNKEVSFLLAVIIPNEKPRNSIITEESSLLVPLISDITPDGKLRNLFITSFNKKNPENKINQKDNDILGAGLEAYKSLKDLKSWYKRYLTDSGAADDKVEDLANKRFFKLLNDQDYRQGELARDNLVTGLVSKLGSLEIASGLVDEEALVSSRELNQEDFYKLTSKIIDSGNDGSVITKVQASTLVDALRKDRRDQASASPDTTMYRKSIVPIAPPKKNWPWKS